MPEKICERCGKPIKPGEAYAEVEIGTGRYVHWPKCPTSEERARRKMFEMAKKYKGVKGVVKIRDEKGVERWMPKSAYLKMLEAGRKVTLLEEKPHVSSSSSEHPSGSAIFYFETKEDREKAYNILASHNFYFPYGPEISLTDIDEPDYMLELLESAGFDTSKILVKRSESSSSPEEELEKTVLADIEILSRTGVPPRQADLYARAIETHHVEWSKYLEALKSLIRKGEVYSPREGYYALTSSKPEEEKLWRLWFTTPRGFEASLWAEAKTVHEAHEKAKKKVPEGSTLLYATPYTEKQIKDILRKFSRTELEAVAKGTPCAVEAYLHVFHTEKVPVAVQRAAQKLLAGEDPLKVEVTTKPRPEERFLVDGLTSKDYYDLRDLRLLLWGLEKELVGKYGIIEAEPLAARVRDLIKEKISEINSRISASPKHHSSPPKPVSREEVEAEVDVLIDNLIQAIKTGGEVPDYLREALRKSFTWLKTDPSASTGTPGKFTVRFNEGTSKQEDIKIEAPSREAATILAARKYHEKHGEYPKTARILASEAVEKWRERARVIRPPW